MLLVHWHAILKPEWIESVGLGMRMNEMILISVQEDRYLHWKITYIGKCFPTSESVSYLHRKVFPTYIGKCFLPTSESVSYLHRKVFPTYIGKCFLLIFENFYYLHRKVFPTYIWKFLLLTLESVSVCCPRNELTSTSATAISGQVWASNCTRLRYSSPDAGGFEGSKSSKLATGRTLGLL